MLIFLKECMQIIKLGKIPEPKVYQGHCSNCGTMFTFTEKETTPVKNRDEEYLKIECPLEGCYQIYHTPPRLMKVVL